MKRKHTPNAILGSCTASIFLLVVSFSPAYADTTWISDLGYDITGYSVNCCSPSMSTDGSVMIAVKNGDYVYTSTSSGATWRRQTALGQDGWVAGFVSSDGGRIVLMSQQNSTPSGNGGTGGLTSDSSNFGGNGGSVTGYGTAHNGVNGQHGGGGGGGSGYVDGGGGGGGSGGEVIVTEVFPGPATTTTSYFSNATWTNPGGLNHVIVQVWGGGGGGAGGGGGGAAGGDGAASSFTYDSGANTMIGNGGHGGTGGFGSGGAGGTASGGTTNTTGTSGSGFGGSGGGNGVASVVNIAGSGTGGAGGKGGSSGGTPAGGSGPGAGGTGGTNNGSTPSGGSGGSGGYAERVILGADLGATETITVGGGGGGGGGNNSSGAGGDGTNSASTGGTGGDGSEGGGGGGGGFAGIGGNGVSLGDNDVYVSTDEGLSWTLATTTYPINWVSLSASADTMNIVGENTNDGFIYLSQDGGVNWAAVGTTTVSNENTFITPDGKTIYAYDGSDPLYKSTNDGVSWTSQDESAFYWNYIVPTQSGSTLYATNDNDGFIYTSTNDGAAWTQLAAGPSNYPSIATSGDGSVLLAAPNGSADVQLSTDGGSTWEDQISLGAHTWGFPSVSSDGSLLVVADSDDPAVWVAQTPPHSNTSNNSGNTSVAASAGLPWCSGPSAPGWNVSLPGGGCGGASQLGAAVIPLAAQIPSITPVVATTTPYQFTRSLHLGMNGSDVMQLQKYLNAHGFALASSGPGSPGQETQTFGQLTYKALIQFQNANAAQILAPVGLSQGSGIFGPSTMAYVNSHP